MNAARVREFAGVVDVARIVDGVDVLSRVEAVDRPPGDRSELRGALRQFLQRGLERLLLPAFLAARGDGFHT
jgi:hypothetical protein